MYVDPSATNATVTGAIRHGARMTGTNFQYLLATAQVESNFNPNAKVATSSARGLYQFIEQTWLQTLKEQGPALGYGAQADAIVRLPSGKYVVDDPRMRGTIMNMRSDPTASAVMAGAFTRTNAARLAGTLGRAPTEGELYIAHFLGPTGAGKLIGLAQSRPTASAATAFPSAAQANRTIFYERDGRARSADEVYRSLVGRYQVAREQRKAPADAATAVAAADISPQRPTAALDLRALADTYAIAAMAAISAIAGGVVPAPRRAAALDPVATADTYAPYTTAVGAPARTTRTAAAASVTTTVAPKDVPASPRKVAPDPVASADTYPRHAVTAARTTAPAPAARAPESRPIFHGLFHADGSREPVAPLVSALWTTPLQPPASKPAAAQRAPAEPASRPLDLFQDSPPDARALFRGRV